MKILFFLESLRSGGKERRAVELFHYLKKNTEYKIQIVLTEEEIHYKYILDLGIPIIIVKRSLFKKDPTLFFKFFRIIKKFKPDIIHAWGGMTTLYAIPTAKYLKIPLINSQIADAFSKEYRSPFMNLIWKINHYFSDCILANSKAGLNAYNVKSEKGKVIYNGIRLERFQNLKNYEAVRQELNIKTEFVIIMVATFGVNKDYSLYFNVAEQICKLRNDVTFLAVGDGVTRINFAINICSDRILFTGKVSNVEELVNTCDIGILFSRLATGEGISNAIMEYMALSKPVIATDAGGTNELVDNNNSGYLVKNEVDNVIEHINNLLDNQKIRLKMGEKGRKIIEHRFTLDQMGKEYSNIYEHINSD